MGGTVPQTYCEVEAAISPIDATAPDIRLRLALPTTWNGNAFMFGGGGYDGTIPNVAGNVLFGPTDQPTPLQRGYATFGSDSGHQADPAFVPTTTLDGTFGANDEAVRNFAGDALKKTHDAAAYLVTVHYGREPAHKYFAGGSTGGREALAVAQRWPRDFDGVIAVYPAWNAASLNLYFGHIAKVMSQPGAFLEPNEQTLLHTSVMRACDARDGLSDNIISNEPGCEFDPRTLRCPLGADAGSACLSDAQITAVRAVSSPLHWKYHLKSGERGYPGFPFLSGAKMSTPLLGFGSAAPANPMPKTSGYGVQFWDQWVRYFVTRDPSHDPLAVDPLNPRKWKHRVSELSGLQDVNDADLRPFARAGGKLLILHGAADELVSHRSTAEYYERVRDVVGPRQTADFARFYVVPGANHVNRGAQFAASWDSLTALETWSQNRKAPVSPVVKDASLTGAGRTRPLCQYPAWPRYSGTGSPNDAASFTCVTSR
ncbi:tannase/feruloyl esterase family alpha/beta hydrolase [Knoellia sp. S7-12]|uniref:tannase/feruloyl esterase family alpha/beta hydrolase n=1 Tax=Knoellia sp. S7-12 TaxID=3126698 RepID=UPI0033674F56